MRTKRELKRPSPKRRCRSQPVKLAADRAASGTRRVSVDDPLPVFAQPILPMSVGQSATVAPSVVLDEQIPAFPQEGSEAEPPPEAVRWVAADLVTLYMRDAGKEPLLTAEEEVELSDRIQQGDDLARDRMIRANLRLVVKIAREYEHLGLPLLDLVNEGNIGLMTAVDRFDPRKGAKFSTYSSLWIRQQIRRAVANQGKTIRLPINVVEKVYHLSQAAARFRGQFGRDASHEELAVELDMSPARVRQIREAAVRPASLDAPLGTDDANRLSDVIADENGERPDEQLEQKNSLELLREILPKLPKRQASILNLRFGLDGSNAKTLEEIGSLMGVTRERIRQLQNLALSKLRRLMQQRDLLFVAA